MSLYRALGAVMLAASVVSLLATVTALAVATTTPDAAFALFGLVVSVVVGIAAVHLAFGADQ